MSLITLKRSARTFPMAALPRTRRPFGSGPRAMRNVASSSKKLRILSTSRALKAALMSRSRSMLGPAAVVVMAWVTPVVWGMPSPGPKRLWPRADLLAATCLGAADSSRALARSDRYQVVIRYRAHVPLVQRQPRRASPGSGHKLHFESIGLVDFHHRAKIVLAQPVLG